jgi:hypothetical protein
MASVKGFTLKGVTRFKGHEGEPCVQGSIYNNGKKVGYYSDSYTMGPPDISFNDKAVEEKAIRAGRTCYENQTDYPEDFELETLFDKIKDLIETERDYKKYVKMGYPVFAVCLTEIGVQTIIAAKTKDGIEREIAKKKGVTDVKFYEAKDFDIG